MEVALDKKEDILNSGRTFDAEQVRRKLEMRSDFSFAGRHHRDLVLSVDNGRNTMSRCRAAWLNYPAPHEIEHRQVTEAELSDLYTALLREADPVEYEDELVGDEQHWEDFNPDDVSEEGEAIVVPGPEEDFPAHMRRIDFAAYERPHYVSAGAPCVPGTEHGLLQALFDNLTKKQLRLATNLWRRKQSRFCPIVRG